MILPYAPYLGIVALQYTDLIVWLVFHWIVNCPEFYFSLGLINLLECFVLYSCFLYSFWPLKWGPCPFLETQVISLSNSILYHYLIQFWYNWPFEENKCICGCWSTATFTLLVFHFVSYNLVSFMQYAYFQLACKYISLYML